MLRRMDDTTDGLDLEKIIPSLARGTRLLKTRSLRNYHLRHFYLDVINMRLKYYPSRKKLFCKAIPCVDLDDVDEIREGWNSDVFNSLATASARGSIRARTPPFQRVDESCCFTVITTPDFLALDLVAPNKATRDVWVKGLNHMVQVTKATQREQKFDKWLKKQFRIADVNQSQNLSFDECLELLKILNVQMDRRHARNLFKEANFRKSRGRNQVLDPDEFVAFFRLLESRPDLEDLFRKYCIRKLPVMGSKELMEFLTKEQHMSDITLDSCATLIKRYERPEEHIPGVLGFRGFRQLLLSKDQRFHGPGTRTVHQDMTQPLHQYFISSSHNTYLRQGQLVGASSVDAYIRALKIGIRCIEIDMWNGPQGEPIVFHGYTFTTRILLRDVLEVIQKYAFHTTPYPLIISLENHCGLEQQAVAAELFLEILKGTLYVDPVPKNADTFPSPEQLKNRILLKAKKSHVQEGEEEEEEEMLEEEELNEEGPPGVHHYQSLSRQLSELVNYCKATRFKSFQEVKENGKFYEMSSFSESTAEYYIQNNTEEIIDYTREHLARIYPSGLRTSSSNFVPDQFWTAGCQLVALNVQGYDEGAILNKTMFLQNGGCGYVLKPNYLIKGSYDPLLCKHGPKVTLSLKMISGQCIPKPGQATEGEIVDPYVTLKVYGHRSDLQKHKTKHVRNNGFNPVWNEEFEVPLHYPELALLVLEVKDQNALGKNRRLALCGAPFNEIQLGYRHIHLWDDNFQDLVPSTLFVHVTVEKHYQTSTL